MSPGYSHILIFMFEINMCIVQAPVSHSMKIFQKSQMKLFFKLILKLFGILVGSD